MSGSMLGGSIKSSLEWPETAQRLRSASRRRRARSAQIHNMVTSNSIHETLLATGVPKAPNPVGRRHRQQINNRPRLPLPVEHKDDGDPRVSGTESRIRHRQTCRMSPSKPAPDLASRRKSPWASVPDLA